jgi:hypothetical protein
MKGHRRRDRARTGRTIVGFSWYRPEQWERLVEISEDKHNLEDTYSEWIANATKVFDTPKSAGANPIRIEVDTEELLEWC